MRLRSGVVEARRPAGDRGAPLRHRPIAARGRAAQPAPGARAARLAARALGRLPGLRRARPVHDRGHGAVGTAPTPGRPHDRRPRAVRGRPGGRARPGRAHRPLRLLGDRRARSHQARPAGEPGDGARAESRRCTSSCTRCGRATDSTCIYSDRSLFAGLPVAARAAAPRDRRHADRALGPASAAATRSTSAGGRRASSSVRSRWRGSRGRRSFRCSPCAPASVATSCGSPARFDPRTPADSVAALVATVRRYERVVRERPAQWLMFEDVWSEADAAVDDGTGDYEMVPQASGLRRR